MTVPGPGNLLISDPFLKDPTFQRTVIILCEHQVEGSFGLVLNKLHESVLGDLISEAVGCNFPVFRGGPVQKDSIHFLHQRPDIITGGFEIVDGIYWGGDFAEVLALLQTQSLSEKDIRFFIGYSGWGQGQLEEELKEKTWITRDGNKRLVFHPQFNQIWREALSDLGGEYEQMPNYPIDPQLN